MPTATKPGFILGWDPGLQASNICQFGRESFPNLASGCPAPFFAVCCGCPQLWKVAALLQNAGLVKNHE